MDSPLEGIPCRVCGYETLRIEFRHEIIASPIGKYSLAGQQIKVSAMCGMALGCV